ncbi:MAG: methylthioribulose 1-phosphate dehydratase [Candidatus Obscuribacterales bacterium]|nr:methylthioribulose 1-phosphate dehydratase [Candidatus Obscuribacterales bacterium]
MFGIENLSNKRLISQAASEMAKYGQLFYAKGWNLATSSNYSAVISTEPLNLLMTASGKHKGELTDADFVVIDEKLKVVDHGANYSVNNLKPSAEAALHVTLAKKAGAKAVLHSHSIWSTIVSRRYFSQGYVTLHDFEMLKALQGINSHDATVRIVILENSQDIGALAQAVEKQLSDGNIEHAFLLKGHGLYTWGSSLAEARNQIEALEFMFEVIGQGGDDK